MNALERSAERQTGDYEVPVLQLPAHTPVPKWSGDELTQTLAHGGADIIAAAETHTGAMIALVPTEEDAERLAVDGGEEVDELHLTLAYLGETALIPEEVQHDVIECVARCAADRVSIVGNAFAIALFNPETGMTASTGWELDEVDDLVAGAGGPDPCVVLLVAGQQLPSFQEYVVRSVAASFGQAGMKMHEQHSPWVAHLTLAYTDDADLAHFLDRTGPVTFDRVRVAFGGDVYDIPLGEAADITAGGDHWREQDRVPRGTTEGGQWTDGSPSSASEKSPSSGVKPLKTGPLTDANKEALTEYSSLTGYVDLNDRLRTGSVPDYREEKVLDETIAQVRDSMRPLPDEQTVYRGVNIKQFPGITTVDELPKLVGEMFRDEGFTSTSTEMIGRFVPDKDDVLMTVRVPKGYPHVDLSQNSVWSTEKELLLDAGTEFRVIDATPPGKIPRWQLTLEVVPRD